MDDKTKLEKLGNIELDADNILFGVTKDGDTGLNFIFNSEVDCDNAQGRFLQENIANMLAQIANVNDRLFHIITKAFAEAVTLKTEEDGKRRNIVVEILNETPKKKEPEFKVQIDNKYRS